MGYGCNVGGLPKAQNKAENNCRTQGSASGCLGQPATGTDRQGCERLLKATEGLLVLELVVDTSISHSDNTELWHLIIS